MKFERRDFYKRYIRITDIERLSYSKIYTGSSTETVAFQVYEILKIDHEFLKFF